MTDQPDQPESAAQPALEGYVLLSQAPADMGAVLSGIQPSMGDPFAGVPLEPAFGVTINGTGFILGAEAAPISAPGLEDDLATNPVRSTLLPVVREHAAYVRLGVTPMPDQMFPNLLTWVNVLASLVSNLGAKAIWIPQQMNLMTDGLFLEDLAINPALCYARVHAVRLNEEGAALGFTAGLYALGSRELQIRAQSAPSELFMNFRAGLAEALIQNGLPRLGSTISIGGVPHQVVEGTSPLFGTPAFDLVPAAPAEQPKK